MICKICFCTCERACEMLSERFEISRMVKMLEKEISLGGKEKVI